MIIIWPLSSCTFTWTQYNYISLSWLLLIKYEIQPCTFSQYCLIHPSLFVSAVLPVAHGIWWGVRVELETWNINLTSGYDPVISRILSPRFQNLSCSPRDEWRPSHTDAISNPPTTTCNCYWCTKVYKTPVACFKETFEGQRSKRTYNSFTSVKRTGWPDTQFFKHVGIKKVFLCDFSYYLLFMNCV